MSAHEALSAEDYARWCCDAGFPELGQILFWRWDPIGVDESFPITADEYDSYARELLTRLRRGAGVQQVAAYLAEVEEHSIGLRFSDDARLGALGQYVVDWHATSISHWVDLEATRDGGRGLGRTIPALPVRDVAAAVAYYRRCFGFDAPHVDPGSMAILRRDGAEIHLWAASDCDWESRDGLAERPIASGAESFLAGTASCRIEVEDVDGLFVELRDAGVLHPVAGDAPTDTDFGSREFPALDLDGNLIAFYRWRR